MITKIQAKEVCEHSMQRYRTIICAEAWASAASAAQGIATEILFVLPLGKQKDWSGKPDPHSASAPPRPNEGCAQKNRV